MENIFYSSPQDPGAGKQIRRQEQACLHRYCQLTELRHAKKQSCQAKTAPHKHGVRLGLSRSRFCCCNNFNTILNPSGQPADGRSNLLNIPAAIYFHIQFSGNKIELRSTDAFNSPRCRFNFQTTISTVKSLYIKLQIIFAFHILTSAFIDVAQPLVKDLFYVIVIQRIKYHLAIFSVFYQSGLFQHPQLMGNSRLGHMK